MKTLLSATAIVVGKKTRSYTIDDTAGPDERHNRNPCATLTTPEINRSKFGFLELAVSFWERQSV